MSVKNKKKTHFGDDPIKPTMFITAGLLSSEDISNPAKGLAGAEIRKNILYHLKEHRGAMKIKPYC